MRTVPEEHVESLDIIRCDVEETAAIVVTDVRAPNHRNVVLCQMLCHLSLSTADIP